MVLDHFCYFFTEDPRIAPDTIRILTRISMPLFCILAGYFAFQPRSLRRNRDDGVTSPSSNQDAARSDSSSTQSPSPLSRVVGLAWFPKPWRRIMQVTLACVVLNFILLQNMGGKLEILASILVGYAMLKACCSSRLPPIGAVVAVAALSLSWGLFPWDLSRAWFDYPLTVVVSSMAAGALMRWSQIAALGVATATALVLLSIRTFSGEHQLVTAPSVYVLIAQALAAGLVVAAIRLPGLRVPGLTWAGKFPLAIYVAHYLVFYGVSQMLFAS